MNCEETKYLAIGGTSDKDLEVVDGAIIGQCRIYKYSWDSYLYWRRKRIDEGRVAIQWLHPLIWYKNTTRCVKKRLYKTIVDSIATYSAEVIETYREYI